MSRGKEIRRRVGSLGCGVLSFTFLVPLEERKIKRYQEAGMTQLLSFMQIYNIPHQKLMDSIRLFGRICTPLVWSAGAVLPL